MPLRKYAGLGQEYTVQFSEEWHEAAEMTIKVGES